MTSSERSETHDHEEFCHNLGRRRALCLLDRTFGICRRCCHRNGPAESVEFLRRYANTPTEVALVQESPGPVTTSQARTGEPEPSSPPEDDATAEIVSTRTPAPAVTPGLISAAVDQFTASTGLAEWELLGVSADDWINLASSSSILCGMWRVSCRAGPWISSKTRWAPRP